MSYAFDGHWEWIEKSVGVKCSALGKQVADILGYVGRGMYNAPINRDSVKWDNPYCIEVSWRDSMSNWDFPQLTLLVLECHRRMIRVEICPNMKTLKLMFHQRHTRDRSEGTARRLPDIREMIEMYECEWQRPLLSYAERFSW